MTKDRIISQVTLLAGIAENLTTTNETEEFVHRKSHYTKRVFLEYFCYFCMFISMYVKELVCVDLLFACVLWTAGHYYSICLVSS